MIKRLLQAFLIVSFLLAYHATTFAEDEGVSKMALTTVERENQTVQLKVNEEVSIDEGKLVIHLVRIIEDIRCPADVACIWSGYVKIEITTKVKNLDYGHHFISNIDNEMWNLSSEIKLDKYTIKLNHRGVNPERNHQGDKKAIAEIMQQEYIVELVIGQ